MRWRIVLTAAGLAVIAADAVIGGLTDAVIIGAAGFGLMVLTALIAAVASRP